MVCAAASAFNIRQLKEQLTDYIAGKDARIGIALIVDGADTLTVNNTECYPMLSVYKFPQALAVADYARRKGMSFADTVTVSAADMRADTWSPMRDRYGTAGTRLPLRRLLAYSLQLSDNNACDVLFGLTGGPAEVDRYIASTGIGDIHIRSTEAEMHVDINLCYDNCCTPLAMAMLTEYFATHLRGADASMAELASLMESCSTGTNRLPAPLAGTQAVFGHKTGTGDTNAAGCIIGVNDVGYVLLPDGRRYTIAVFIKDSAADLSTTSGWIGEISAIVFNTFGGH